MLKVTPFLNTSFKIELFLFICSASKVGAKEFRKDNTFSRTKSNQHSENE